MQPNPVQNHRDPDRIYPVMVVEEVLMLLRPIGTKQTRQFKTFLQHAAREPSHVVGLSIGPALCRLVSNAFKRLHVEIGVHVVRVLAHDEAVKHPAL